MQSPIDADGVIPQALEETFTRLEREGRKVKFFYTIPNYHNPAGVCVSEERRPQIVEICKRHHVLIVEDNPYGLLGFDGRTYTSFKSLAPDHVLYLGSALRFLLPVTAWAWACGAVGNVRKAEASL